MSRPDCRNAVGRPALLAVILALCTYCPAQAQRADPGSTAALIEPASTAASGLPPTLALESLPPKPRIGIGGLVGRTSGLTVRVVLTDESRRSGPFEERAVDVNASFNLDGYLHVTAHVTAERPVEDSPLTFYIGPGWLAGSDNGQAFFGASGNIGVYFTMDRYQIIMQLMPGIRFMPDVNGETGAAVGLRIQL